MGVMQRRFGLIILFLLVYNFVFPIKLKVLPVIYLAISVTPIFFLSKKKWGRIFSSKVLIDFVFLASILTLLGSLSILLWGSNDIIPVINSIKFLFVAVVGYLIAFSLVDFAGREKVFHVLIRLLVFSAVVVGSSATVEFFSPGAKELLARVIDTSGNIQYESSFRVHGLASSGGASLSVGVYVSLILCCYLAEVELGWKKVFFNLVGVLLLGALIFIGRTGLYFGIAFVTVWVLRGVVKFGSKRLLHSLFLLIFSFLIVSWLLDGWLTDSHINIIYSYSFELLKGYLESGEVNSRSTAHIRTMFYLPEWNHFIFGAGFWRFPTYGYELSDVGYIKLLMAYGIFGVLSVICFYFLIFYRVKSVVPRQFDFYFVSIFVSLFVVELKEEFLLQNYAFKILLLIVLVLLILREVPAGER